MKKLKLVMVGNGMAGVRTLEELLKIAPDLYDITVFGAEPHPNYNRILLSPVLAGEQTIDEIILNDWSWYADNHITLHTGFTVTDVDRVRRVVSATGAAGVRPWCTRRRCRRGPRGRRTAGCGAGRPRPPGGRAEPCRGSPARAPRRDGRRRR